MSQYKTGTATVTNGSPTVTGTNTLWLANVTAGDSFTVAGDGVMYDVASVDSDTQITLSVAYAGATASGVVYTIARDFTSPDNFPELTTGDIETPTIITRAFRKIQSRFTGIAINTTAEIGQAVSDHVALADPHTQYALESKTPVDFGATTDDVDTVVKSGFYRVEQSANLPSGAEYGQLIVSRGGNTILQLVSNYTGRLWQRSGNPSNVGSGGSYSDWQEIPSLVGGAAANFTAMPQVGGDPIVESGSNADGEWTRWADGTQITSNQFLLGGTYGTRVYGFYAIDQSDRDFSVPFLNAPKLSISVASNLTDVSHGIATSDNGLTPTTSTNTGRIRGLVPTSTGALGVDVIAYGRWK